MRAALARSLAVLPAVLLLAACSVLGTHDAGPSPHAAASPGAGAPGGEATQSVPAAPAGAGAAAGAGTPAAATVPAAPTVVSVLGDSHSGAPDSWYRLSVADSLVPGASPGILSSHAGRTSLELRAWVGEATARGGVVLVQAGTNDILRDGAPPAGAAAGVELLVRDVLARHVRAVLVSVPPSAVHGTSTVQLNRILRAWAGVHGVPWLDVTSPVTAPDGTWLPGLSSDGVHANEAGGALMALAVRDQLPGLLGKS
jgi:lysophospholipase L1-like esterase